MLSISQIKSLSIMARHAFDSLKPDQLESIIAQASEAADDPFGVSRSKAFDWWRHQQQLEVTGRASLKNMVNEDFNKLKARYLFIQGNVKGSLLSDIAATEEDCRQLRWLIQQACGEYDLAWPGYAETVCKSKSGHSLEHASADVLKQVLYTINNRGRHSNRRKPSEKPKIDKKGKQPGRGFYIPSDNKTFVVDSLNPDRTVHKVDAPF
ncbi:MAG: hypothetical protein LBV12_08850 [Puniceicoccales bacterium]|jgi:hypothetical protein|nr:hypothetical protein [Puniceicoccales bacterium]